MFVYGLIAVILFLLVPSVALAWGPGVHVEVALTALANVGLAIPPIRKLMKAHPDDFIYGASAPDIIIGKKLAGYMHHCHNWRMGWLILNEAETDRQRAGAYGYLMHLAADVVAHNYYIPFKIVRSYDARMLSHMYWEMRFDLGIKEEAWKRLGKLAKHEFKEFDDLLNRILRKTIFSFKTNKRIFNGILVLQKMRSMRHSLGLYARKSRWHIEEENRQHYLDLVIESAMDFLAHPETAACLEMDPTGEARIAYARNLRRRIRLMRRRGLLDDASTAKMIDLVKERLAVALYRPDMVLPDVVDVL
jgi:hypothetical protein